MKWKILLNSGQMTQDFCDKMGWDLEVEKLKTAMVDENKIREGLYCIFETTSKEDYNFFKAKVDNALGSNK